MSYGIKKQKILFTGHGEKLIDNVIQLIQGQYEIEKCPPLETNIRWALKTEHPAAVVVCLMNETREMVRIYDSLESENVAAQIPVILIGDDEDCFQFQSRLSLKGLSVFKRPLDREGFVKTLQQICEAAASQSEVKIEPKEEKVTKKKRNMEMADVLSERKSILVVDDDVRMLNVIKLYLQDLYDVTVVPSGKLALKFVSKRNVDLILLDYLMPEMDGPEVLKEIRVNAPDTEVPVIFLTGVSDKDEVMRGLEYRPNGYLLKPVTKDTLLERVTEVLLGL